MNKKRFFAILLSLVLMLSLLPAGASAGDDPCAEGHDYVLTEPEEGSGEEEAVYVCSRCGARSTETPPQPEDEDEPENDDEPEDDDTPGTEAVKVFFELCGHGEQIAPAETLSGALLDKPADPAAEGYAFSGWYRDRDYETAWVFDSDRVTGELTLYARWEAAAPAQPNGEEGAEGEVETVSKYNELQNALDNASTDASDPTRLALGDNISFGCTIQAGTWVVLDLNSFSLTDSSTALNVYGNLTLTGSGSVIGSVTGASIWSGGSFTLTGGVVSGENTGVSIFSGGSFTMAGGAVGGSSSCVDGAFTYQGGVLQPTGANALEDALYRQGSDGNIKVRLGADISTDADFSSDNSLDLNGHFLVTDDMDKICNLSLSGNGAALVQPQDCTLKQGYAANSGSFTVEAKSPNTLSYKWYSNTTESNSGGTELSGATQSSYAVPTGKTSGTEEYYYCVVADGTAVFTTRAAKLTIEDAPPPEFVVDSYGNLIGYNGPGGNVVIPSEVDGVTVKTIQAPAFRGNKSITGVSIPDSVTAIGEEAFYSCASLTSVTIPDSVTAIGKEAFEYCDALTSATIGNGVKTIGNMTFMGCDKLASVTIGNSVETIGAQTFQYCSKLTSVTIPDSVTTIGVSAFLYCSGLTSVTIPDSVTFIGGMAFDHCTSLASVTIGNGVTTVSYRMFRNCTSLKELTIPNSVLSIQIEAFKDSGLTDIWYDGTFDQWNAINGHGNIPDSTTVHCLYTLSVPTGLEGGSVAADNTTVHDGKEVTLTATADEYYELAALSITYTPRGGEETTDELDLDKTPYTFVMPAANVSVTASFKPAKSEYSFVSDTASWTKRSGKSVEFHVKRAALDGLTFGYFDELQVDGKTVAAANYSTKSGSIYITLKASYLETLSVGEHTVKAVFTDAEASATFKVLAAKTTNSPATGDGGAAPWIAICALSAVSAAACALAAGRRRRERV